MKRSKIKTTTYERGEYLIDITFDGAMYEAWVCHEDYGVKMFMFGYHQDSVNEKEFKSIVESNLDDQIGIYRELHQN